jgi:hypothetical protein
MARPSTASRTNAVAMARLQTAMKLGWFNDASSPR